MGPKTFLCECRISYESSLGMLSNETTPKSPDFVGIEILQLKGVQIDCPLLTPLNYNISVPIKAGHFGVV